MKLIPKLLQDSINKLHHSLATIDNAPATTPANVACMIGSRATLVAATPMAKLVLERIP